MRLEKSVRSQSEKNCRLPLQLTFVHKKQKDNNNLACFMHT